MSSGPPGIEGISAGSGWRLEPKSWRAVLIVDQSSF
jgi:hypothetical protein